MGNDKAVRGIRAELPTGFTSVNYTIAYAPQYHSVRIRLHTALKPDYTADPIVKHTKVALSKPSVQTGGIPPPQVYFTLCQFTV